MLQELNVGTYGRLESKATGSVSIPVDMLPDYITAEDQKGDSIVCLATDDTIVRFVYIFVTGVATSEFEEVVNKVSSGNHGWTAAMLSKFASFRPHARVAACHQSGGFNDSWEESTGSLVSISEEQFDNCSKHINGCNSGLMDYAFTLYKTNAIASESSYSHNARDGVCKTSSSAGYSTVIVQSQQMLEETSNSAFTASYPFSQISSGNTC